MREQYECGISNFWVLYRLNLVGTNASATVTQQTTCVVSTYFKKNENDLKTEKQLKTK